jgi:hypothetical protein
VAVARAHVVMSDELLKAIDQALVRIDEGTFGGHCEVVFDGKKGWIYKRFIRES